jgi:hypothetical protein
VYIEIWDYFLHFAAGWSPPHLVHVWLYLQFGANLQFIPVLKNLHTEVVVFVFKDLAYGWRWVLETVDDFSEGCAEYGVLVTYSNHNSVLMVPHEDWGSDCFRKRNCSS